MLKWSGFFKSPYVEGKSDFILGILVGTGFSQEELDTLRTINKRESAFDSVPSEFTTSRGTAPKAYS